MQNNQSKLFFVYKRTNHFTNHNGFTILELLIALVISSVLAVGVGSVYYGIRSTQNSQNSVSEIRDNLFIALDRIESVIKQANFTEYSEQKYNPNETFMQLTSPILTQLPGDSTNHTSNATATNGSDTFTLDVSSPDNSSEMVDCTGAAMPASTYNLKKSVYQKFTVSGDNLMCSTNVRTRDLSAGTDSYSGFSAPIRIAAGVRNMQVFYAVKDEEQGCGVSNSSNAWKTASEIADFSKVCAMNISLLAISQTGQIVNVAQETTSQKTFNLALNNTINDNVAKNITMSISSSLLKNTRVVRKIVFLRNNDKY
ncbi:MAG: hypothetical protein RLZZ210_1395 [Pseudomonadota bacterium]|jgi:prepilin-type N-terminal cleavage/methylation domain-containing protein